MVKKYKVTIQDSVSVSKDQHRKMKIGKMTFRIMKKAYTLHRTKSNKHQTSVKKTAIAYVRTQNKI